MLPGLEFRTCDRSFSRRSSGTRAPPRMRCKIVKGFRKAEGVDSLMEFWFSFHRKHRSPPSRRTKSPRATFPSTINALLYPGVEDDERIHLVLDFTSRGETSVSFPARSTLIEFQAARGTPGPHRRPSLSSVKLGSYPAWSLRGSESRQPTSSCVGSLRARHRHRHRPIRKRNVDGAAWRVLPRHASRPTKIRPFSLLDDAADFSSRVCVCAWASRKPPPSGCVARITLAAWQNASSYREKSRTLPFATVWRGSLTTPLPRPFVTCPSAPLLDPLHPFDCDAFG